MKGKLSKKGLVVKKLSDAIKAIIKSEGAIKDALEELASDEEQTPTTRHEASSISEKTDSLEFAFMVLFWYDLLDRIHKTNLSLQKIDISLSCVVDLINTLKSFVSDLRNRNQFNKYLEDAKSFSDSTYQEFKDEITRRKRRKKASDEGMADDVQLSGPDRFYVNTFLAIIDSIQSELTRRKQSYQLIYERFDFLSFPKEEDNIVEKCNALKEAYPLHFDDNMVNEVIQFFRFGKEPLRSFLAKGDRESCDERSENDDKEVSKPTAQFLLELVIVLLQPFQIP